VLRWSQPREQSILKQLARATDIEPEKEIGYSYLLSAAITLGADVKHTPLWQAKLEQILINGPSSVRNEACQALQLRYAVEDLSRVVAFLDNVDGDTRIGAALLVIRVLERNQTR
jgi:hypothetical protein